MSGCGWRATHRRCLAAAALVLCALLGGCESTARELPAMQVKTTTVNGAEIQYVEQGRGETLVFLHGAGTDWRIWDAMRPYMAARYRFVAYSRRHHHPNAWPDDGSSHHIAQHVDDLAALVRVLGVDRVHIVAVSLGGQVAARMLVQHPDMVADVVLSDALLARATRAESKPVVDAFMRRFAPLRAAVAARDKEAAATALVDWITDSRNGWAELPRRRQNLYRDNADTLLLMVHESAPPLSCSELGQVSRPVLVLEGAVTPAAFRLTNEQLLSCLPRDAEHSTLPGAGHFWYSSHPAAAAKGILEFLVKHPIPRRAN